MIAHHRIHVYEGCDRIRVRGADCTDCEDWIVEAWERMTYGGLKVPTLPGYTTAHAVETPRFIITQYSDKGFWI